MDLREIGWGQCGLDLTGIGIGGGEFSGSCARLSYPLLKSS
jgi:hypothetical protein